MERETPARKEIKALIPGFSETINGILEGIDVLGIQTAFPEYFGIDRDAPEVGGAAWHPKMYSSPRPYDTALEAAQGFFTAMRNFVANDKPKRIAWRVKPEIKHQTNFDTYKDEFSVYARLFYLPTV